MGEELEGDAMRSSSPEADAHAVRVRDARVANAAVDFMVFLFRVSGLLYFGLI
jgi:hypothetical protein